MLFTIPRMRVESNQALGIGIYFAKRVVQDHGGNVGAFSEGIGKGSTFWMELPMHSSPGGDRGNGSKKK